jgi:puromycin-sensitive aminopeptidase
MHDQEAAVTSVTTDDYRLPTTVTPQRYEILLNPDLRSFTFAGEQTVAITVHQPTAEIVLNAIELEIDRAVAERNGRRLEAVKVELDAPNERARIRFNEKLDAGPWCLTIAFRGILNDKLHGFYRSQYKDAGGLTHMVASTQFEATDARRAFPCWDEPALKASFKVRLTIDEPLTAISNTAIESQRRLDGGKKEITFKETIRMSTYLLAFIIGEFEATDAVDIDGAPLRVVHVPGKRPLTSWGREIGAFSLKFFANYYGIKYPGDKLDLIAIPDFAAGAMENLGAITFRETALLVDEKTASRSELERVADVVSHENAHMWFGDLVTMKWWNGLWLNEAFATFMEMLAVDAWKPQWQRWVSFGVSRASAMGVDGLNSTRSIEYTVRGAHEAGGMFDVLTYEKGAAVLRMLEQYLGAEEFRKGISLYLRKHQYGNAETTDLWDALEESSRQPVRKMMDSWIFQPGFPIVSAKATDDGHGLALSQRRFLYLPGDQPNAQLWHVPVMVKARTEHGISTHKLLLTEAEATLKLPGRLEWALVNQGGHGFYRARYAPEMLGKLTPALNELAPIERFALVSDTLAAVLAGLTPLAEFLNMTRLFRQETDLNVWRALLAPFNYLDMVIDDAARPALQAKARELLGPAATRLGWAPHSGEDELQSQLRGTILGALGTLGDDRECQARAREFYARYKRDASAVNRNLVPALISILAYSGGEAEYREFKDNFKSARNPQEEQRYLFSLAGFRRPDLLRATMDMTLGDEVRTQNAPYLMESLLFNTVFREEAWRFFKSNWDKMIERYPENSIPRMCEGVIGLFMLESEVREFFATHKVKQGGKTIDQHLERLRVAVAFRKREAAGLERLLKS